jgi:uncharacterized protein (TIGR04255 family)
VEITPATSRYSAPPIMEAVIQITFSEAQAEGALRKLVQRLKRDYANLVVTENVNTTIDFQNRTAAFDASPQTRLSSQDEADALLVNAQTLTWSRLAPYEGWESLFGRVERDLREAIGVSGYRKISRMGVRYINRLDVPFTGPSLRYEDYLTINLTIPEAWPTVENYGWRFERAFGSLYAIVQSAVIAPEIPNTGAFLLDIDVVDQHNLPAKLEDVLTRLQEMRHLKNEIFESSISDKAREQFSI